MVDCVDEARYVHFHPGEATRSGFLETKGSIKSIMWPNAHVDTGAHLKTWLPDLKWNPNLPITTIEPQASLKRRVVLYASSTGVNQAWFAERHANFWLDLAAELGRRFNTRPLIIGSAWDAEHCAPLMRVCDSTLANTSLPAVAGILEHARVIVGVASGMTILGNAFRTPTVGIFPDKHAELFPWSWCEPDMPYRVARARLLADPGAAQAVAAMAVDVAKAWQS
jgi:ADP-heptose:LPS heptosyltransferase